VSVIRITDKAASSEEVVTQLRKTADFIEGLGLVGEARVIVTGELNVEVHYEPPAWEEKRRLIADIRRMLPFLRAEHPELVSQIEVAMKQVEQEEEEVAS
jgi:hypothetical protein